jgi:hypothetical protein
LRKENAKLRAEIRKLQDQVSRLVQMPKADAWPKQILEAQRIGFAFGVAHGVQESIRAVKDGVASLNVASLIAGGIDTLNTAGKAAPEKDAKDGAKK